jgi:hypothetical protein
MDFREANMTGRVAPDRDSGVSGVGRNGSVCDMPFAKARSRDNVVAGGSVGPGGVRDGQRVLRLLAPVLSGQLPRVGKLAPKADCLDTGAQAHIVTDSTPRHNLACVASCTIVAAITPGSDQSARTKGSSSSQARSEGTWHPRAPGISRTQTRSRSLMMRLSSSTQLKTSAALLW